MKPSEAIRSYNSCKDTYNWMRDSLHLSNGDIASLSEVIGENESEVGALVEQAASERAARYAYDHPKLPEGFVTIEQLQGDLDLGDLRDEVEDFDFDGDITKAFGETAEYKVDDNYHALLTWLPDHTEWLEEAEFDGLLENCKGDIYKVEGDDLAKVNDFLKKSCMEFCGSLPGDEMGEDSYSLTGEARDAATSRNGLNENRKSVAEISRLDFCALAMNAFAVVLLAIVLLLFVQNRICKQLNRGDHMALRVVIRHGHTGCCGT